jgi:hypothetical protein
MFGGGGSPAPLGRSTLIALSSRGIAYTTNDSAVIELRAFDWSNRQTVRVADISEPLRREEYELGVEAILENVPPQLVRPIREQLRGQFIEQQRRPFDALMFDECDRLWAFRTSLTEAADAHAWVWDARGQLLMTTAFPRGTTAIRVVRNEVVALERSEHGVNAVILRAPQMVSARCGPSSR